MKGDLPIYYTQNSNNNKQKHFVTFLSNVFFNKLIYLALKLTKIKVTEDDKRN